ncbi:hypothetical protein [Sinomicrobium sp.]
MNEKELHLLLDKYLKGQCSKEEKELLDKLFDSYDHKNIYSLSEAQNKALKKEMFLNIKRDIREKERQSRSSKTSYSDRLHLTNLGHKHIALRLIERLRKLLQAPN